MSLHFVLILLYYVNISLQLGPMERNDNLKHVQAEFIAEWQWESWPLKQEYKSKQDTPENLNINLWSDPKDGGSFWYLYDRKQNKNTDPNLWRYSSSTRSWEKLYPISEEQKTDWETRYIKKLTKLPQIKTSVCAVPTKPIDPFENTRDDDFRFSVWRKPNKNIEKLKKENEKHIIGFEWQTSNLWEFNNDNKTYIDEYCLEKNENDQKLKSVSKIIEIFKSNQTDSKIQEETKFEKKNVENETYIKTEEVKSQNMTSVNEDIEKSGITKQTLNPEKNDTLNVIDEFAKSPTVSDRPEYLNDSFSFPLKQELNITLTSNSSFHHLESSSSDTVLPPVIPRFNMSIVVEIEENNGTNAPKESCPNFRDSNKVVSWCHTGENVIIAADLNSNPLSLWLFDIFNRNWTEQKSTVSNPIWTYCVEDQPLRVVDMEDDLFIFCKPNKDQYNEIEHDNTANNLTTPLSTNDTAFVLKVNINNSTIEPIGEVKFKTANWQNESKSLLQLVLVDGFPLLVLAREDSIDLWILYDGVFKPIDNVWRGSAKKWFQNYNSSFYNLNFMINKNSFQTILTNPRKVKEYWSHERGRFIVRILRNENIKIFEKSEDEEENLIYSLLQSDSNPNEYEDSSKYYAKVFLFFGASIIFFSIIGIFVFVKRCITCPRNLHIQSENKSPPIIRYSVIDDDILASSTVIM